MPCLLIWLLPSSSSPSTLFFLEHTSQKEEVREKKRKLKRKWRERRGREEKDEKEEKERDTWVGRVGGWVGEDERPGMSDDLCPVATLTRIA